MLLGVGQMKTLHSDYKKARMQSPFVVHVPGNGKEGQFMACDFNTYMAQIGHGCIDGSEVDCEDLGTAYGRQKPA